MFSIFYLQLICRTIKCSPGKIYANGDCSRAFLKWTSHINYGLAAKVTFKDVVSAGRVNLHQLIEKLFYLNDDEIPRSIASDLEISNYNFVVNTGCRFQYFINPMSEFEMYLHMIMEFVETSRQQLERKLLGVLNNRSSIQFGHFSANFKMQNDKKADPSLYPTSFPPHYCKGERTVDISYIKPRESLRVFMIDKFLLCPQITLNDSEYVISSNPNKLKIVNARQFNAYIDYTIGIHNDVRVCLNEYDAIMTSLSDVIEAWHCTIVSLITCVFICYF